MGPRIIVDLPSDIIVTIIAELKSGDDCYSDHIYPNGTFKCQNLALFRNLRLDWMASTQFCRHWRYAAIYCASLWSHIDVSVWNDNLVTLFLERSKTSKLSLVMSLFLYDWDSDILRYAATYQATEEELVIPSRFKPCLDNLYRTRSLAIAVCGNVPWYFKILEILESTEMPVLEHFAFDGSLSMDPLTFKNAPFNNFTPKLQSLALRSVSLPSDSSVLCPSESLLLEFVVCRGTQSLDDILRSCSSLTDLHIDSVKAVDNDGHLRTLGNQPVSLPHLGSFSVCGSTMLCDTLARICVYPPNTQSNVSYMFLGKDDTLPRIPSFFEGGDVRAYVKVEMKSTVEVQWKSQAGGANHDIKYSFGMQKSARNFWDDSWSFHSLVDILGKTAQSLDICTLFVANSKKTTYVPWRSLFNSMENLVSLTIHFSHWGVQSFAEALGYKEPDACTLSNLSDLTIISISFFQPESYNVLKETLLSRQSCTECQRLRNLHFLLISYADGEAWASKKKDLMDVLRPTADQLEVTRLTKDEANTFVKLDDFRICRRIKRYGCKTEFRR